MPYTVPAYLIRILKTRSGYRAEVVLVEDRGETRLCATAGSKTEVFAWVQAEHTRLIYLPPDEALPIRYEAPWVKYRPDRPVLGFFRHPEW